MKKVIFIVLLCLAFSLVYYLNQSNRSAFKYAIVNKANQIVWPIEDQKLSLPTSTHYFNSLEDLSSAIEIEVFDSYLKYMDAKHIVVWQKEQGIFNEILRTPISSHKNAINISKKAKSSPFLKNESVKAERSSWRNRRKGKSTEIEIRKAKKSFLSKFNNKSNSRDGGISSWEELGPDNIGGRIRSVVSLSDPNVIIAASAGGGLLRGELSNSEWTWSNIDDFNDNLAFSCLAIETDGPNDIIYAGTGEFFAKGIDNDSGDGRPGNGLYKSVDNGVNWTKLPNPPNSDMFWITEIVLDPFNPDIIYVLENGTTQSGSSSSTLNKIHKSTDGGLTWAQPVTQYTNSSGNQTDLMYLMDIKIDPTNSQHILVSTSSYTSSNSSFRLIKSYDGGNTFVVETSGLPTNGRRAEISIAPSNPSTVYLLIDRVNQGELYKSFDGGESWFPRNVVDNFLCSPDNPTICQGSYNNAIWVDPLNDDNIVTGGIELNRSTDGGVSFSLISDWKDFHNGDDIDEDGNIANSPHADHHFIVEASNFSPTNRQVFFANDGGVAIANNILTVDVNSGWTLISENGFNVTQFYTGAAGENTVIGGAQDNSYLTKDLNTTDLDWYQQSTGDGAYSVVRPSNNEFMITSTQNGTLYRKNGSGSPGFAFYARFNYQCNCCNPGGSSDSNCDCGTDPFWCECSSFTCCSGGTLPAQGCSYGNGGTTTKFLANDNPDFIAPMMLDPSDENTLYFGGRRLWVNTGCWASFVNFWSPIKAAIGSTTTQISAIEIDPQDPSIIWVGYNNGVIEKTSNGGTTWSGNIAPNVIPDNPFVTDISISPVDQNRVAISFGGYNNNNIYFSLTAQSNNPSYFNASTAVGVQINALEWHPTDDDWLYAGTDLGVIASETLGIGWSFDPLYETNEGPANTEISDLFWSQTSTGESKDLFAATHGRGMWVSNTLHSKLYVDKNNTGEEDGSMDNPFNTLKEAYEVAGSGTEIIFISNGIHNEINAYPLILKKRIKITLNNGAVTIE